MGYERLPEVASSEHFYAALYDIGQLLARALEPPALYEAVIEVLQQRIGAMLVMVGEVDRGTGWFQRIAPVVVPAGMADIYPERLPLSVVHESFWRGIPHLEENIRHVPGLAAFQRAYERHGVGSAMAFPILKFGEVSAALVIRAAHPSHFSGRMVELLQQAAVTLGLGLEGGEQRRLLLQSVREEARQRAALRLLSETIKVVTHSANQQELLTGACEVVQGVGGFGYAWIGLLEGEGGGVLRLHAQAGAAGFVDATDAFELTDAVGTVGVAARAIATGQANLGTDDRPWPAASASGAAARPALAHRWLDRRSDGGGFARAGQFHPRRNRGIPRRWPAKSAWACRCSARARRGCWPSRSCSSTWNISARSCPTSMRACW